MLRRSGVRARGWKKGCTLHYCPYCDAYCDCCNNIQHQPIRNNAIRFPYRKIPRVHHGCACGACTEYTRDTDDNGGGNENCLKPFRDPSTHPPDDNGDGHLHHRGRRARAKLDPKSGKVTMQWLCNMRDNVLVYGTCTGWRILTANVNHRPHWSCPPPASHIAAVLLTHCSFDF